MTSCLLYFFLWRSESPFCWGRETPLTQVVEFLYFLNELNPSRSPEEPLSPQTWNTPWCIHWHQLTTFFSGLQSTADHLLTNSDHRSHLTDLSRQSSQLDQVTLNSLFWDEASPFSFRYVTVWVITGGMTASRFFSLMLSENMFHWLKPLVSDRLNYRVTLTTAD